MKTIILTTELSNKPNAMDLRLKKIIYFFSKISEVKVYYPSNKNQTREVNTVKYVGLKTNLKIRYIRRFLYKQILRQQLKSIILQENPDIIYTQDSMQASLYNNKIKSYKIFDILGLGKNESTKGKTGIINIIKGMYLGQIEKRASRNADYIFTVNEAHKRKIQKLTSRPVFVIRDGVEKSFFQYNKKSNIRDAIKVAFVGSLGSKRILSLITNFNKILKQDNKINFLIIGDGPDLQLYKKITKEHNIENNVQFTGYIKHNNIKKYIIDSSICFSDDWSYIGFPTKVFEYMAMGKAILVEDTPAVREIINENVNGLLYKDANDFVKKVLILTKDKALRERVGKQARKDAFRHTWNQREKEFNKLITKITSDSNKIL